jgi:hypothetical protein
MKNSFSTKTLKINKTLTTEEQNIFRQKFKPLLKIDGIMSLCLEAENLYVEYNPVSFNLDSFKLNIMDIGFPLKLDAVLS